MFFPAAHHLCAMTLHGIACIRCFWQQLPSNCGLLVVWAAITQLLAAHCNAALELVQLSLLPSSGACTIAIKHVVLFFPRETGNA